MTNQELAEKLKTLAKPQIEAHQRKVTLNTLFHTLEEKK